MSNIAVTHSESGLVRAEVVRRERVTPNMVRVTLGGADLRRFDYRGFDQ
ncbi:siderophore-interacting protein, partial [Leifsonia sp. SIMBA_070]